MNSTEQQQRNLEEQNQISSEQENKAELLKLLKEINSQLESTSFYNKGIKRRETEETDIEQNYNVVDEVYLGGSKDFNSNFTKTNPPDETPILDILREVNSCENLETPKRDQCLNTGMKQVDGNVQEDDDDQEDDVKMTPLHFLAEIEEKTMLTSNNLQSRRKKQRKQIRNGNNMN